MRDELEPYNRSDEREEKKKSPKFCRLFKKENSHNDGSNGTDACPYGICCTDG